MDRQRPAPGGAAPLELELLIETAYGLAHVELLAAANAKVTALHLGVGDLAASLGARSLEIGASPRDYLEVRRRQDGTYSETPVDFFGFPMMRLLAAACFRPARNRRSLRNGRGHHSGRRMGAQGSSDGV